MAQVGVVVQQQEIPPAIQSVANTANAFMVGVADWGPVGASGVNTPVSSLNAVAGLIGPPNGGLVQSSRTTTNATLYDSAEAFFREGGGNVFVSRVLGNNPTFGSLGLQDSTGSNTATLTAAYLGTGSSGINVVVTNSGSSYTVRLQDTLANPLVTSPALSNTNKADLISWAAGTGLVTATAGNANLPKTITATPLSTGTDDRGSITLTNWQSALNGGFSATLGPGQVLAPAQTNTGLAGIWLTLGNHAVANNRVALLDGTDGNSAAAAVSEVSSAALPASVQSYCGIWAGNLQIPGITSGTTRVIPPSPVVAALCARADNLGNPNVAAAGTNFPPTFVSGINTLYTDGLTGAIATLNGSGINCFTTLYGILQNYGFVSAILSSADAIYWQLSHSRLRMAITNAVLQVGQNYVFDQIDGNGVVISQFNTDIQAALSNFYTAGALYGASAPEAFTVDTSSQVNSTASIAAGNLLASCAVRMSPFAQLVTIVVNAVAITQTLPQAANSVDNTNAG